MTNKLRQTKISSPRTRRLYRLELDGRTMLLMVGLLALTGVVVFYLGMLSGMGMRGADEFPPVASITPTPPAQPGDETLTFNRNLRSDDQTPERLNVSDGRLSRRTNELISQAQRELVLEEVAPQRVPITTAPTQPQAAKPTLPRTAPPTVPQTAQPAAPRRHPIASTSNTSTSNGVYTVQVFSSRSLDKAQSLITKLKRQGFSAYLNQFKAAGSKTWFRVRVGRTNRQSAETLKQRLIKEAKLRDPNVLRL